MWDASSVFAHMWVCASLLRFRAAELWGYESLKWIYGASRHALRHTQRWDTGASNRANGQHHGNRVKIPWMNASAADTPSVMQWKHEQSAGIATLLLSTCVTRCETLRRCSGSRPANTCFCSDTEQIIFASFRRNTFFFTYTVTKCFSLPEGACTSQCSWGKLERSYNNS